jgi:valyl-tRNA synthetase
MPFITEELWQRLVRPADGPVSIALAELPRGGRKDDAAVAELELVRTVIGAARTIRSERDVHPGAKVELSLRSDDAAVRALLEDERSTISFLVKTETLTVEARGGPRPKGAAISDGAGVEVLITLRGVVDAGKEIERVEREVKKAEKDIAVLEKKLSSKGFVDRAPPEVVAESQEQLLAAKKRRALLDEAMSLARELEDPDGEAE